MVESLDGHGACLKLDQAGPMTRSAADAAVLLQVMSGNDPKIQLHWSKQFSFSELIEQPIKDLSIGVVPGLLDGVSSEIVDAFNACQAELKALGATFQEVELLIIIIALPLLCHCASRMLSQLIKV